MALQVQVADGLARASLRATHTGMIPATATSRHVRPGIKLGVFNTLEKFISLIFGSPALTEQTSNLFSSTVPVLPEWIPAVAGTCTCSGDQIHVAKYRLSEWLIWSSARLPPGICLRKSM
ncbi:hypothetical protein C7T94_08785 [Pedobacter yulinensis]|uniref:Uncharacterized protein n=1 Tax=Pedobacter yulinensis TaxID=2126353 RepID=A0A2T3HJW5_9SPHI|nr:hypothetical protein C7T94_08785 [Pedobacter yulinensis]